MTKKKATEMVVEVAEADVGKEEIPMEVTPSMLPDEPVISIAEAIAPLAGMLANVAVAEMVDAKLAAPFAATPTPPVSVTQMSHMLASRAVEKVAIERTGTDWRLTAAYLHGEENRDGADTIVSELSSYFEASFLITVLSGRVLWIDGKGRIEITLRERTAT